MASDSAVRSAPSDASADRPETARAVRLSWFGGSDALMLDPVAVPQPGAGEMLVRVAAASINPVDYKIRNGGYPMVEESDLPKILGRDLAGTVAVAGEGAAFKVGDPVFAFLGQDRGAQADYVLVKAGEAAVAPASVDLVHAAAVPLAALTAWQGLFDHGGLTRGQRVLIHGGAGGVGHFAVQFAKVRGATVFTTAGTDGLEFVRDLGADTVIDYKQERFEDAAADIDLVFDLIGGETQDRSWAVLREGGIMVSTLGAPDEEKAAAHKARAAPRYMAQPNAEQLAEIARLIDAGEVRVEVSATFPLDEVRAGYDRLEQGHGRGKIVLTMDEDGETS